MTNLLSENTGSSNFPFSAGAISFRQQIIKVFGYIVLFFLSYVILLLAAVALAVVCITGGVALIRSYPVLLSMIPGIALVVLGVMTCFLLFRFLIYRRQPVNPYRTQISADSHPRLFDLITQLVKETRISFPKKIFIVPDVNAALFYHSSFLSLFWPVRKNLEIGLGLVNSVNISEFKTVLAHEFGHFSQRSMKLGSYVYGLNRMLYNMLYENDSWNELMIRWSSAGSLPGFFILLSTWIVNVIQYVLRKIYQLINRQYMEMSREMEFKADALAVSLTGTAAAVSSLRRVEMGSYCLDHCLHKLPELAEQQCRFRNVFQVQRALIRYYASQNQLELDSAGLPVITDAYFKTFLKSRVQLRDQWTTHPTREAREARYRQADVRQEPVSASAWQLFDEPEALQESVTEQVYSYTVPVGMPFTWHNISTFMAELEQRHRTYEFPKAFNDYYDNRAFAPLYDGYQEPLPAGHPLTFQTLYHPDVVLRIRMYYRDLQDTETLQAIAAGHFQTRVFEFDGQKYRAGKAGRLAQQLAAQVSAEREWLETQDQLAFRFHYTQALAKDDDTAAQLKARHEEIIRHQENANRLNDLVVRIIHCISVLFHTSSHNLATVLPCIEELSGEYREFRKLLQEVLTEPHIRNTLSPEMNERIRQFHQHDGVFIRNGIPEYGAIKELHDTSSALMEYYNNSIVLLKKEHLESILRQSPVIS
ncbi:M48 family metallopeptidase [Chitinophaga vietnamensis]|uniref:M48 family metallopeptidase n=1 Tax=Chitinophaga vietnamensis TaxID=2593957 RepID=UPI0011788887|nr:M48 family metallopeptidase [Chitinophaga vietnamensis]